MATVFGLLDLGDDAVERIFVALRPTVRSRAWSKQALPLSQTCRRFDLYYRHIFVTEFNGICLFRSAELTPPTKASLTARIIQRYPSVSDLSLPASVWHDVISAHASQAVFTKHVTSLAITGCERADEISSIPQLLPALLRLHLAFHFWNSTDYTCFNSALTIIPSLKCLTSLSIESMRLEHSWASIATSLENLPLLRRLHLWVCLSRDGPVEGVGLPSHLDCLTLGVRQNHPPGQFHSLLACIASSSQNIRDLNLKGPSTSDFDWSKLSPLASSLRNLEISELDHPAGDRVDLHLAVTFSAMTGLQGLSLEFCDCDFGEVLRGIAALPSLQIVSLHVRDLRLGFDAGSVDSIADSVISQHGLIMLSNSPSRRSLTLLSLSFDVGDLGFPYFEVDGGHSNEICLAAQRDDAIYQAAQVLQGALEARCINIFTRKPGTPKMSIECQMNTYAHAALWQHEA